MRACPQYPRRRAVEEDTSVSLWLPHACTCGHIPHRESRKSGPHISIGSMDMWTTERGDGYSHKKREWNSLVEHMPVVLKGLPEPWHWEGTEGVRERTENLKQSPATCPQNNELLKFKSNGSETQADTFNVFFICVKYLWHIFVQRGWITTQAETATCTNWQLTKQSLNSKVILQSWYRKKQGLEGELSG